MSIELLNKFISPDKTRLEVVERKGLGHPDTLADGIAESAAIEYAKYCLDRFGIIPHHNLDKATIIGGLCLQKFGGGQFVEPVKMIFQGRASKSFGGEIIPLEEIQSTAAKNYIARVMPHLDINNPLQYASSSVTSSNSSRPYWYTPESIEDLPEYAGKNPRANDTATMTSYWPLTNIEKLALDLEGYFYKDNQEDLPEPRFDFIGQDIKVMCVRNGKKVTVTICIPQVTSCTPNRNLYNEREEAIEEKLLVYAKELMGDQFTIKLKVNPTVAGKNPMPYLVTGGSCVDFGEEGAVGRGNKTHGLISSFRPNTMEAPHGKNPVYFVGKILGYQADLIAKKIYERLNTGCQVIMQADIGDDLFDPARIIISTEKTVSKKEVDQTVTECLNLGRETTNIIINSAHFIPRTNSWVQNGK